jgi:enoyl-CoA hydratase/carnithine racemase
LTDAADAAATEENVRVIVLTGAKGCFTAGNDIADFGPADKPIDELPILPLGSH